MQIKIDVLRALKTFRRANGASEADAVSWAKANLAQATQLAQKAAEADPHGDPLSVRRASFRVLKDLATAR